MLGGDSKSDVKKMIEEICSEAMDSSNALNMLLSMGLFSNVFMKPEHKALLPLIMLLEKKRQRNKTSKLNQISDNKET